MRTRIRRHSLPIVLVLLAACGGTTPPLLSPVGRVHYQSLQVVRALDTFRDAAITAHDNQIISEATTRKIVQYHQAILPVVQAADQGWQATVLNGLTALEQAIPAAEWQQVAAWVNLVKVLVQEVPK